MGQLKNDLISVVIPTFNRSESIRNCIESVLNQSYSNIEVLICDDCSTDNTMRVVASYDDKRLRCISSKKNGGASAARNMGIKAAHGKLVFFTDDDVIVSRDWIKKGLKYFTDPNTLGFEGKIIYVRKGYVPQYSDRVVENINGGLYMTANAAYRRDILLKIGLFNLSLRKYQDRDVALNVLKHGNIFFAKDCVVTHQKETYTVQSYMYEAQKIKYWFELHNNHPDDNDRVSYIFLDLSKLISVLFPPLVLVRVFQSKFVNKRDWQLFALIYPRLVYERYNLWKSAIKYKKILI